MGLPYEAASLNLNVRGGKGPIYLDNVKCSGYETSILDCPRSDKKHNCGHDEDVGVIC